MIAKKELKLIVLLTITLSFVGCSSSEKIKSLDDYLSQTDSSPDSRSVEWYNDQDDIRAQVLDMCYFHFLDKAATSSDEEYVRAFNTNLFSLYESNSDCKNAKAADIKKLAKPEDQGLINDENKIQEIEIAMQTQNGVEDIDRLAEDVAQKLKQANE